MRNSRRIEEEASCLKREWERDERWLGIRRPYAAEDVIRLRGSLKVAHTLADVGARKLWKSLKEEDFVQALGALTGNQAMQQVKAGLKAIGSPSGPVGAPCAVRGR